MKTCSTCGVPKDYCDFYRDKRNIDGLYSDCKDCHNLVTTAWIKNNPESSRISASKYYFNNTEKVKKAKKLYLSNPENRERKNRLNRESKARTKAKKLEELNDKVL